MHAFWLVLTYDLLEDRRTDDVITENFSLCFSKMAESFENLEAILPDWVNEDVEKKSCRDCGQIPKARRRKTKHVSL